MGRYGWVRVRFEYLDNRVLYRMFSFAVDEF